MRGTVTFATRNGAFFFVRPDGSREDLYFHESVIIDDADAERMDVFDRIEFDTAPDQKKAGKLMAANVRIICEIE
jgi:cold shock CspA family protein